MFIFGRSEIKNEEEIINIHFVLLFQSPPASAGPVLCTQGIFLSIAPTQLLSLPIRLSQVPQSGLIQLSVPPCSSPELQTELMKTEKGECKRAPRLYNNDWRRSGYLYSTLSSPTGIIKSMSSQEWEQAKQIGQFPLNALSTSVYYQFHPVRLLGI